MATRALSGVWAGKGVHKTTWTGLLNADQGAAQSNHNFNDKTVQISGTLGVGGTVSIEGSNDGSTWHILNDSRGEGNALTFTTLDTRTILENPLFIRPNVTAGDGSTALTVVITESGQ